MMCIDVVFVVVVFVGVLCRVCVFLGLFVGFGVFLVVVVICDLYELGIWGYCLFLLFIGWFCLFCGGGVLVLVRELWVVFGEYLLGVYWLGLGGVYFVVGGYRWCLCVLGYEVYGGW